MYLASMDIKPSRGEAEARRKNYGEPRHPRVDCVSSPTRDVRVRRPDDLRMRGEQFLIQSMSPLRKRRSSQIVAQGGRAAPGKCGGKLDKEKNGRPFRLGRTKSTSDMQLHVGRQLLDHAPLQSHLEQVRDLIQEEACVTPQRILIFQLIPR